MNANCVLIFAKAPIPGKVKTRLQPALTHQECARLSENMIRHSVKTALTAKADVQLWCFPDPNHAFFEYLEKEYPITCLPQHGINLGDRMRIAMATALEDYQRVQLIGSDCPFYTPEYLQKGFEILKAPDQIIIGPAEDGGYLLIGSNRPVPDDTFNHITWGTDKVLRETLDKFEFLGITPKLLPTLSDIDRPEDLALFR